MSPLAHVFPPALPEGPTLVGHRGMGAGVVRGHQQNTVGSFLAAVASGVDWVEVDVRRTGDDELFVRHDAALPDGTFLTSLTGKQARRFGLLGVEDLLEVLPPRVGVVFDVKSSMDDGARPVVRTTGTLLARACDHMLRGRPALAQSFDPAALSHMRQALPTLALGLLTWLRFPVGLAVAAAAHLDVQVLAVHAGSLRPGVATGPHDVPAPVDVVRSVHEVDRQLLVWCPSPRTARELRAAGVDAMVVDDPPRHVRPLVGTRRRTER